MARSSVMRGVAGDPARRHPHDFYATPRRGTRALLAVERFRGPVWEPACGDGTMAEELTAAGYRVRASDLHDRGYGESPVDFLAASGRRVANVVTNPPFRLAEEFARHALEMATAKVALLCPLSWLESAGRRPLLMGTPLARVWVFSDRLRFDRDGAGYDVEKPGGTVAFAWYVWERGHAGPPTLGWLPLAGTEGRRA